MPKTIHTVIRKKYSQRKARTTPPPHDFVSRKCCVLRQDIPEFFYYSHFDSTFKKSGFGTMINSSPLCASLVVLISR